MFKTYYKGMRDWDFSQFSKHKIRDDGLIEIAEDVVKMLEEKKTLKEIENILYQEYFGFEEGERFIEINDNYVVLSNDLGEEIKIVLIDFEKELNEIKQKLEKWLSQYSENQKFLVYYDRWQNGGHSAILEAVALDGVYEETIHDVYITTNKEGVRKIYEDWADYIFDSEDWDTEDRFSCDYRNEKDETYFELKTEFRGFGKETITIYPVRE